MKNLPLEILLLIFSFLEPKDKIECMTVCRSWEHIIEGTCLLETIRLSREEGLRSIIDVLHSKHHLGRQVKNLIMDTFKRNEFVKSPQTMYDLLPNLKVLYLGHNSTSFIYNDMILEACRHSLEHLIIATHVMAPFIPADMHTYPNLKSLSVNGEHLSYQCFFDLVMKVPNISYLHLYSCWIRPDAMELLHELLPKLTSIKFEDMNILSNKPSHINIVPSPLVTSFICEFNDKSSPAAVNKWLHYIIKKYPNLTEFTLRSQGGFTAWPEKSLLEHVHLLESYHRQLKTTLKKLYIHIVKLPLALVDKDGLTDDTVESIATILERNKRSLIPPMTDVQDDDSIPTPFNPKTKYFDQHHFGFTIPMMTELILNFKDQDNLSSLALHRLVTMCPPTLESLELANVTLIHNRKTVPRLDTLKTLKLSHIEFSVDSGECISAAFRNVKTLILDKCKYRNHSFIMASSTLLNLQVINDAVEEGVYLRVDTTLDHQTHYYTVSHPKSQHASLRKCSIPNVIHLYPPTKKVTLSPVLDEFCFLDFVCASIHNVEILP